MSCMGGMSGTGTARVAHRNDDEIWRAAKRFVERFGADAPRQALLRAQELRAAGDEEGCAMWELIRAKAAFFLEDSAGKSRH